MLSSLIKSLLIAVLLFLLGVSILRFNAYIKFDRLNQQVEQANQKEIPQELIERLITLSQSWFLSYRELASLSRIMSSIGENQADKDKQLVFLCQTVSLLGKAIDREPLNSRSLVTWASLRQLLGSFVCPEGLDSSLKSLTPAETTYSKDWELALELAVKSAPLDQQVLFNAALVSVWGGKFEQAYPRFYRVLELGTDSTVWQREYVYSLVKDSASLAALIPATIPQVLEFLRFAESGAVSEITRKKFAQQLVSMQLKSLEDFKARLSRKEIDNAIYEQRLSEMWELSRHSGVLTVLDRMLAGHFSETFSKDLSDFFSTRSKLSELRVMSGYRAADSRPQKSALANWGTSAVVAVDNFFSSVGFYLPRNSTLRRIELHSKGLTEQSILSFIRVLASDDNGSWEDVTGLCTISSVFFNSKTIIQIDLPGSNKAFWKINFQNAGRSSKFFAPLDNLIRAFGIGGVQ